MTIGPLFRPLLTFYLSFCRVNRQCEDCSYLFSKLTIVPLHWPLHCPLIVSVDTATLTGKRWQFFTARSLGPRARVESLKGELQKKHVRM